MSKVLVDRELLERTVKHLECDGDGSQTVMQYAQQGDRLAEELAEAIARPAEAEVVLPDRMEVAPYQTVDRGSVNYRCGWNAYRKEAIAALSAVTAERDRLDAERDQYRDMAGCMDLLRRDLIEAGVIGESFPPMFMTEGVMAHIAKLRAEVEAWRVAARWSAVRMSGMLASAQYSMTDETTHEVLELHHHVLAGTPEKIEWLAAMAAKEA